jgi:hypothetical protein
MYINLHNLLTQTIIPRQLIFVHFPILASFPTLFRPYLLTNPQKLSMSCFHAARI